VENFNEMIFSFYLKDSIFSHRATEETEKENYCAVKIYSTTPRQKFLNLNIREQQEKSSLSPKKHELLNR
jgi:hypothetical protein